MFIVKSIYATNHDSSFGGYPWKVEVTVAMPATEWATHKRKGWLGQLYGIDISNHVYAVNQNIPAHNPTVDDRSRAAKGVKTIKLTYFMRREHADQAEALGLKVLRLKNGEVYAGHSSYVKIA